MSTNAAVIEFLLTPMENISGVLVGGKVWAYEAGPTTTKKTIWLNRSKATEAANPYTLDSNGTAQLYGDGLYRIVIKDKNGVTVYDRDNLSFVDRGSRVYDVADYASLAAAVVAIGSAPATLQFSSDVTVSANLTIPANIELMPLNGAKINHTIYTISYVGSAYRWPTAQLFNGTGAVTFANGTTAYIYPQWFGADGSGIADSTAAINKAHLAAADTPSNIMNKQIVMLVGKFKVSGQILCKVPMRGVDMIASKILTTENAGGIVLYVTGIDYWDFRDFSIWPFSGALQNFTGIKVDGTGLHGNAWFMQNVYVRFATQGIDITGWIGDAQNVKTRFCTNGFKGTLLNATRLNLVVESCTNVGLNLIDSAGVQIVGGVIENNNIGLQLDHCQGVNIASYFELNTTHAWIGYVAGSTHKCTNITFSSGNMTTSYVGGLKIDNVENFVIKKDMNIQSTAVNVTSSAKQYDLGGYSPPLGSQGWPNSLLHLASAPEKSEVLNLFPNPKFIGGLRGWKSMSMVFSLGSLTSSLETGTTIFGSAMKLTAPAGSKAPRATIKLPDPLLNYLKGKTVYVLAKAFVPDLPDYQYTYDNGVTNPLAVPCVTIQTFGASATESVSVSALHTVDTWNHFWAMLTVPADATDVAVSLYLSRSANVLTADTNIIFGEVILVEAPTCFEEMLRGYKNHPMAGRYKGSNWIGYDSAIPTGSTQTFAIGDEIENSAVSVIGSGGYATANQKYTLDGWRRITNGTAHVLNTDWVEMRSLTGQ